MIVLATPQIEDAIVGMTKSSIGSSSSSGGPSINVIYGKRWALFFHCITLGNNELEFHWILGYFTYYCLSGLKERMSAINYLKILRVYYLKIIHQHIRWTRWTKLMLYFSFTNENKLTKIGIINTFSISCFMLSKMEVYSLNGKDWLKDELNRKG